MAEVDPKIVAEEAKKANSKKDPLFPFPFLLNATTTTAPLPPLLLLLLLLLPFLLIIKMIMMGEGGPF